ncbi:hypothetical protein RRG08_011092 [Elysia crispata]|uniref:Uncharacterized protein n=1 Tax=Elysia crispata TaxID=231223 RepID=A0AAE0Z902_9GAST|nr:hypothetical protein RRG08_011092 [Elysia crispata]
MEDEILGELGLGGGRCRQAWTSGFRLSIISRARSRETEAVRYGLQTVITSSGGRKAICKVLSPLTAPSAALRNMYNSLTDNRHSMLQMTTAQSLPSRVARARYFLEVWAAVVLA